MAGNEGVRRREFLKGIGVAGAAAQLAAGTAGPAAAEQEPGAGHQAGQVHDHLTPTPVAGIEPTRFFTSIEAAVIVALVDTLIPKDEVGPGGVEVGVPTFIDREMAGAFGRGARMYMQGPFGAGTPQQGYQLPLTPAELYRVGLADLNTWVAKAHGGKTFDQLGTADRAAALKLVEQGKAEFAQVPPRTFFNMLLQNTMEGYFGDPLYGGNKNKAVWKMLGFPGAIGMFVDEMEHYRNRKYDVEPKSIQDLG
jgi:gluconate 2-dehydrogenase gamma chain